MAKDRLKILNMNGATIVTIFFRSQVGLGHVHTVHLEVSEYHRVIHLL